MKRALRLLLVQACVVGAVAGCSTDSLEPDHPSQLPSESEGSITGDTLAAAADATLSTAAKNSNDGSGLTLTVKITAPQDSTGRAVVRFDQENLSSVVGSGTLVTAILELPLQASGTAPAGSDVHVHRMLKGWTESGVTWNCGADLDLSNGKSDCPQTGWKMTGANQSAFQAAATASAHLAPGQTGVARFDVTSDVQAFLSGTTNHGWLITAGSEVSRAVFRSREATLKPSLILSVNRPPSAKERLIRSVETGVEGGPAAHDSLYSFGASVAYDFTPAAGYHGLLVTLDGEVVPSAGSIVMDRLHFLRATALKNVELPAGGEALLQSARAILTSSDPAAAFQAHLYDVMASYQSLGEAEATQRLKAIYHLAFDPVQDSAALRRVDDALSGQVFHVYPTPSQTGALQSRSFASESAEPPEPTVYLYVNGIGTLDPTAGITAGILFDLLQSASLVHPNTVVDYFYNRSWVDQPSTETPEARTVRCGHNLGKRAEFPGDDDLYDRLLAACIATPLPSEADIVEAIRQFIRVYHDSPRFEVDAGLLAARIQEYRNAGQHVLVVPHSEGNMMLQQAVTRLEGSGQFNVLRDSSCIGAMSLAAPTDVNWPLDDHHLNHVIVRGDPIPYLGEILPGIGPNAWDPLDTQLSRDRDLSLALAARSLPYNLAEYIRLTYRWGILLHSVDRSYLGEPEPRQVIADSLGLLYKECSIGSVEAGFPGEIASIGFTRDLSEDVIIRNQNGRPLHGRRLVWSSSAPDVASVDSNGTVTTHATGTAVITGRSGERAASFTYRVPGVRFDTFTDADGTLLSEHTPDGGDFTWGGFAFSVAIRNGQLDGFLQEGGPAGYHVSMPLATPTESALAEIAVAGSPGFGSVGVQLLSNLGANYDGGYYLDLLHDPHPTTPGMAPFSLHLWYVTSGGFGESIASFVNVPMPSGTWTLRITYHDGVVRGYLNGVMLISASSTIFSSFSYAGISDHMGTGDVAVTSFLADDNYAPDAASISSLSKAQLHGGQAGTRVPPAPK